MQQKVALSGRERVHLAWPALDRERMETHFAEIAVETEEAAKTETAEEPPTR